MTPMTAEPGSLDSMRARMPKGAWDTHFHTTHAPGTDHHHPVSRALAFQDSLGIDNAVLVQTRLHGATDAHFLSDLQAVPQWRGVALIDDTASDADLDTLHTAGVRGVRYTFAGCALMRPPSSEGSNAHAHKGGTC